MQSPDELYEQEMGFAGEERFPDDPDWRYRGTRAEREALAERFRLGDDEPVGYIEGQKELFAE